MSVAFDIVDLESDVTSSGCEAVSVTADTHGQTFTCNASSAGADVLIALVRAL